MTVFDLDSLGGDIATQRYHIRSQLPSARAERGFPVLALHLSPLLNAVLPLDFPENSTTAAMTAEERQRTTTVFLLRLLQRVVAGGSSRKKPAPLFILEDAQWMDEASWELALAVSQEIRPLLMIIATRPLHEQAAIVHLPVPCRQLLDMLGVQWLRLSGLAPEEVQAMVCQELGVSGWPQEATIILQEKAGGNPFYSQELVRAWRAGGLIRMNGRDCDLPAEVSLLENTPAPVMVQKSVIGRLDRLAPTHQLILKTASVLGRTFTLEALQAIYPLPAERDDLPAHLEALEQLGLLCPVAGESGPTYRFKYALTQEVAYNLLLFSQRRQLEGVAG